MLDKAQVTVLFVLLNGEVYCTLFSLCTEAGSNFLPFTPIFSIWGPYNSGVSLIQTLQVLVYFGVSRVVASGHPDFKVSDLVWGMTGWEEYTLIPNPESLFKINHPELPLS
uniref:Oxidoreductase N-terminal domain-containing protein n=1 Tax=Arundo donax TaxID=35708 RepID=A0A0A9CXQ3_ARUDO